MRKSDIILTAIIGFLDGVLALFVLEYLGVSQFKIPSIKIIIPTWFLIILFPVLGVLGIVFAFEIGKKFFVIFQAARFFWVGTLNTFIDLSVLYFFIWITGIARGSLYPLFKSISFLTATTNSYFWNKYWTFEKRKEAPKSKEYFKFLVITAIGFGINVGVASFVVNIIGPQFGLSEKIWAGTGAIIAAFFAFLWDFSGSKFIVFKK